MLFYQYYYYVVPYMYFQMGIIDLFAITDTQSAKCFMLSPSKNIFYIPLAPQKQAIIHLKCVLSCNHKTTFEKHSKNKYYNFRLRNKTLKIHGDSNKSVFKICQMFTHFPRTITICLGTSLPAPHSHILENTVNTQSIASQPPSKNVINVLRFMAVISIWACVCSFMNSIEKL